MYLRVERRKPAQIEKTCFHGFTKGHTGVQTHMLQTYLTKNRNNLRVKSQKKSRSASKNYRISTQTTQKSPNQVCAMQMVLSLAEKLLQSITLKKNANQKIGQKTVQITLDGLMLRRVDELKAVIDKLKNQSSGEITFRKLEDQCQSSKARRILLDNENIRMINEYKKRQAKFGFEIKNIIENVYQKKYQDRSCQDWIQCVSKMAQEFLENGKKLSKSLSQNKRIRFYYIGEIQNKKYQVNFLHQVLKQKQKGIQILSATINQLKRELKGTFCNFLQQTRLEPDIKISQRLKPRDEIRVSQSSVDSILVDSLIQGKIANKKIANPESHQKENIYLQNKEANRQYHQYSQDEQILLQNLKVQYKDLKVNHQLLSDKIFQFQKQIVSKQERLQTLSDQIDLMQQNLLDLSVQVEKREEGINQKKQALYEIQSQICQKQAFIQELDEKIHALTQEKLRQQQNVGSVYQQLEFIISQCQSANAERQNQIANLQKIKFDIQKQLQKTDQRA